MQLYDWLKFQVEELDKLAAIHVSGTKGKVTIFNVQLYIF